MKMKEKTKKYLAIGGGAVICAGLIVAISLQFGKAPTGEDKLPEESTTATQIVVDPSVPASGSTEESAEEKEVVILPKTDAQSDSETSKPADTRPAQTDQTEQSIQPEVTKPAEPEESAKTDPTQKPDGTKVDTPPTSVDHDTYTPPADTENQNSSGGLPGFDNVPDGGENKVIDGQSDGDINKQVGTMD